jgi:xanthine dehydrogenase accessory factor
MPSIVKALLELEDKNLPGVLCTIVKTQGSTPRHEGSKMLVYPDRKIIGSVGGGEVESRVIDQSIEAFSDGKTRLLHYDMVDPTAGDPGVCGGQVEVFVEPIIPSPLIVIVGGGHVGKAVGHLAKWLNFRVAISDDRPEFCTPEANPDADTYYPVPMQDLPKSVNLSPFTYLVLTTRGSGVDVKGLPALLETEAAFIGVIGSRRRWIVTKKGLIDAGVPEEKLNKIHSPMGLELKAETPEEIAVSIMAEIIMLRNGGNAKSMRL